MFDEVLAETAKRIRLIAERQAQECNEFNAKTGLGKHCDQEWINKFCDYRESRAKEQLFESLVRLALS